MKKVLAIALCLVFLFSLAACGGTSTNTGTNGSENAEQVVKAENTNEFPYTISAKEYTAYQNVFYNDQASDFENKDVTKTGTFTILQDHFNDKTRYYVWGYYDQTKCCDWQWEFVPTSTDNLPENGATVVVKGKFVKSSDALDGYWIENATYEIKEDFKSSIDADLDMTCMSATLERVQLINMQNYLDKYDGKTVAMYGRVLNNNCLQHPYYDSTWTQDFTTSDTVPDIGKEAVLVGKMAVSVADSGTKSGLIKEASITESSFY